MHEEIPVFSQMCGGLTEVTECQMTKTVCRGCGLIRNCENLEIDATADLPGLGPHRQHHSAWR
jgi:hypothetical protein